MIPEIGLMIGFFIITVMLSYISKSGEKREHPVVNIFALLTIIFTVIIMIDLFARGVEIDKLFSGIKFQ
jgi:hypothetical protein